MPRGTRRRHESSSSSRSPSRSRSRSSSRGISRSRSRSRSRSSSRSSSHRSASSSSRSERSVAPRRAQSEATTVTSAGRIPRLSERPTPKAPSTPLPTERIRVFLEASDLMVFEAAAAGRSPEGIPRSSLLKEAPIVASPFASLPVPDESIPRGDVARGLILSSDWLRSQHELALASLSYVSIAKKEAARAGLEDSSVLMSYLEGVSSFLAFSIKDLIYARRERHLRSLGLDPRSVCVSYNRLPLEGSLVKKKSSAVEDPFAPPELFGKILRDELAEPESSLTKSIKLLQRQRHVPRNANKKDDAKAVVRKRTRSQPQATKRTKAAPSTEAPSTAKKRFTKRTAK